MNQPPLIFLGLVGAFAVGWYGMIVQPQLQLGRATPGTNVVDKAALHPQARPGLAQQGLQVYRSLGCVHCHSQQVRQDGVRFDLVVTGPGTNTVEAVAAVAKWRPETSTLEAKRLLESMPLEVFKGTTDKQTVDAALDDLLKAGTKAEIRLWALGPDIARGWGRGRSVAADYLYDRPALPGTLRLGPDLANAGARLPSADWHYRHFYEPRTLVSGSLMPPYRFLFDEKPAGTSGAPDAFRMQPGDEIEIVPTDEARSLVAYLLSLKSEVALFERPIGNAPEVQPASGTETNAAPAGPEEAP